MTTVADVINSCKNHLYGTHKEIMNVLDGAINNSVTSFTVKDTIAAQIGTGSIISIDDELIYVRSTVPGSLSIGPVIRGFRGTTAVSHSDAAVIEVEPRFPQVFLRQTIKEEILSWPADLFRTAYFDLSIASGTRGYNLSGASSGTDDFRYALQLSMSPDTGNADTTQWTTMTTGWEIDFDAPTSVFSSGRSIVFNRDFDRSARLTVGQDFNLTDMTDTADLVSTSGLTQPMVDIVPYGVAWRLLATNEARRSFFEAQGEYVKADQVPPMFQIQLAEHYQKLRDSRIRDEIMRLRHKYPIRMMGL